ncbi:MAG: endolytic transglycosylase MltG [Chloroflexia bacterium]
MRDFLLFLLLVVVVAALVAVGVVYYQVHLARSPMERAGGDGSVEVDFEVKPGESTADVARHLAEAGLIRSPGLFQLWARFRQMDSRLEAGWYRLRSDMSMNEILERLVLPPENRDKTFTIIEGLRLEEVAGSLEAQGIVPAEDFLGALQKPYAFDFLADRPEGTSLEGYLFPDTYRVPPDITATGVVETMLENFGRKVTPEMWEQARARGMTLYEVLTLASIVEREAVLDRERPIIASVYLNRLGKGMLLQADPTVQYGLGYDAEHHTWWPDLSEFARLGVSSLAEIDHPYNTYRYPGLPPGPICNPGLASIRAVLEPAETDYFFFVAKNDGSNEHAFARTLEEHIANIQRYQR